MISSLSPESLLRFSISQINNGFNDGVEVQYDEIRPVLDNVLSRLQYCFSRINNKYFFDGSQVCFDHLHGDQYAMWLYFLSNEIFRQSGDAAICKKLFLLNKQLHGIDAFYEVSLPDIFLLVHPLATVLGRAQYSDYFCVYQRCGVGSNHDVYPTFGEHLTMHPGSAVLGEASTGDNCTIAAESLVLDKDLAANSLYIGNPKQFFIKQQEETLKIWRPKVDIQ